jgi:hypothetical protein
VAASTVDGVTPVVLEADPTTHALQTSGSGGGGTQYTDGSATITHPIGTIPVYDKSGTITAVSVTNPLPVSASITPTSDTTQTGSITGSGQSVTFAVNAQSTVGIQASGTFSGTILIKGSVDGSTYTPTTATSLSTGGLVSTITSSFTGQANVAGFVSFQLTSVSWTSGTANISLRASTGISNIMLDNSLPAGTNTIGAVTQATASNFNTTAQITDGTNIGNVLKSDGTAVGQNAQLVAPAYKEVGSLTAGALNADLVPSTDVSGYATFALQITGTFIGTLALQGSNDNTNFVSVFGTWPNNTQPISSFGVTGIITGSCNFRYLRVRMTSYTSGTATGTLELKTVPFAQTNINGLVTATANSSTASSTPLNAMPAGFKAVSADPTATTTTYLTQGITDLVGKQVVMPYAINQSFVRGSASATGTTTTSLITAVASNAIYLTSVQVMNTGTVTSQILLQDGNGGTTLAYAQAPAGGGANITFPVPIKNTVGNAWYFAAGSASSTIYISAQGYAGV